MAQTEYTVDMADATNMRSPDSKFARVTQVTMAMKTNGEKGQAKNTSPSRLRSAIANQVNKTGAIELMNMLSGNKTFVSIELFQSPNLNGLVCAIGEEYGLCNSVSFGVASVFKIENSIRQLCSRRITTRLTASPLAINHLKNRTNGDCGSIVCYPAVDPHQSFIGRVRIGFSVRSIRGIRLEVPALHAPHGSYTYSD